MLAFSSGMCDEAVAVLPVLYWFASLLVLYARANSETFSELTQYGGRVVASVTVSHTTHKHTLLERLVRYCVRVLHMLGLDRRCVSRKVAFCAFSVTGLLTCSALYGSMLWKTHCITTSNSSNGVITQLPLLAFSIHCLVRFGECLALHRFRRSHDSVTIFALLAGCSFYVMAALSSSTLCFSCACPGDTPHGGSARLDVTPTQRRCMLILFIVHLVLQVVQVAHHHVLATLRQRPITHGPSKSKVTRKKEIISGGSSNSSIDKNADEAARVQSYHFPSNTLLFRWVLEPHYMCEILMYGVNALNIVCSVLLLNSSHKALPSRLALWHVCGALGLWLFTLCNLSLTAREHRRFWAYVNTCRRRDRREGNSYPATALEVLPRYNVLPLIT